MSRCALSLLVSLLFALAGCDSGTTVFVPVGGDEEVRGDVVGDAAGGDAAVADESVADAVGDGQTGLDTAADLGADIAADGADSGTDVAADGADSVTDIAADGADSVTDIAADGADSVTDIAADGADSVTDIAADGANDASDAVSDTVQDAVPDITGDATPDTTTDATLDVPPGICEAVTCSGQGVCDSSTGAALCVCGAGYETGADPKTCVPTACVPSCAGTDCVSDGCGGSCGACPCPNAVITVQEGEEVIPQTKLHLSGSQSLSSNGIKRYEWEAQQPVGSQSVFLPSFLAADPTFEANVAGEYVFRLTVFDQNDQKSCYAAEYHVLVVPDEAIHIELVWTTEGDEDETNEGPEAGADLDLHFTHPFATGPDVDGDGKLDGWFSQPFDCFWFNAHPNWASLSPLVDDNPGLDRDDTDGAGPENLNLGLPEEGLTYKVGVHYWSDHNFGPSKATVRIYIYSSLTFEVANVELINLDMWEVATVAWPSGDVDLITLPGGAYRIVPNYKSPFFPSE